MKKFALLVVLLLSSTMALLAQRTVVGKVTDAKGEAVLGANVVVKGTTVGTVTDNNGNYSLQVPANGTSLIISYTGYNNQEIPLGASNVVDATITEGVLLQETVISALGVKRNKSDVVYANQSVTGEELNTVANRSALNALQGKVSGVKIGQASGAVGASTRVVLRGETSLTQGNNALIIVDGVPINNSNASGGGGTGLNGNRDNYVDFGNRANDINPDDIETMTVLKGPAATTLYGSRGGSGVILITTKTGKKSNKANITLTTTRSVDQVMLMFKNQTQFGSGYKSCGYCGGPIDIFMGENFAWGPKFDGVVRPWTSAPFDPATGDLIPLSNGKIEQLSRPYSAVKNNLQNFFDIGSSSRINFGINGGTDKFNYLLSYTNFNNKGIVMNTNLIKHNIQMNVGAQFSAKWRSDFKLNYSKSNQRGATEGGYPFGYSSGTPAMAFVTQTPANIPFNELRDYNSPYHDFKGFYGQYSINPYYILDNQDVRNSVDNVISSASLTYTQNEHLSFTGRVSTNFISSTVTEKGPKFNYAAAYTWADGELVDGGRGGNTFSLGSYKESSNRYTDLSYDAYANYTRKIATDFKWNSILGFNSIEQARREVAGTTVGGLVIPGFYDFSNSVQQARSTSIATKYRLYGAYFNTNIGYKNFVFLEYSARQDYSSTLPSTSRSFFYQAGGLSFVPTNLNNWSFDKISNLKIRASVGSAGKDAPLYRLNSVYNLNPLVLDLGGDFQNRFPFNGQTGAQLGSRIGNPNLKPELSITSEVGFDLGLLKDHLMINYTYYNINSKNQIVDVNIPWSSGYAFVPVNIGRMTNKGHELGLSIVPVRNDHFSWKVFGTWSKNKNKVVEILKNNLDNDELNIYSGLVHFSGHGTLNLIAVEGQPFGTFKGTGFTYDDQGRIVVTATGNPVRSAELQYLGSYQPKFLYNFGTELTWRRFSLNALMDGREGGLFYSGTKLSTEFNGTASTTLLHDRQPFVVENSSVKNADGTFSANTKETTAYSYYRGSPAAAYLLDASFLKFRELSLYYNIPITNNKVVTGASIGAFARNIKFWVAKENTFADPEVGGVGGSSDANGIETTTTPPSRSFGLELRLKF